MTPFQMRRKLGNILIAIAMGGVFYLAVRYQDAPGFQNAMNFLFAPKAEYALPPFWQENRMLLEAGLVLLAFLFYWPTWRRLKELIRAYRESRSVRSPPDISLIQASYFYSQDLVTSMAAWLMTMASKGALVLRYEAGVRPWTLDRDDSRAVPREDQQLLATLFRRESKVRLGANLSDPHPDVEETAKTHFVTIQGQLREHFYEPQTRMVAWLVLALLIAEIPFFIASQPTRLSMALPVTMFSAAISFFPAFIVGKNLQRIFTGQVIVPAILFAVGMFFVLVGNHILFSGSNLPPYVSVAFLPNLGVMLITVVTMMPLTAKDSLLFQRIVGYHHYLDQESTSIGAEDLPWTIGLDARSDMFGSGGGYKDSELPNWLINDSNENNQELIKQLHQSFTIQVSRAIFGERASHRSHIGGGASMGQRF